MEIVQFGSSVYAPEYARDVDLLVITKDKRKYGGYLDCLADLLFDMDVVIVSPGIPLTVPIIQKLRAKNIPLIGEIEFGFLIKDKKSKIIAVTGSNGKSTTVSLIAHILKENGFNTVLAGNIGTAFTSFPIEKPGIDYIVLELSSFQLELVDSFRANVAALLNITPDHLNRYPSMDEYALAKMNIFRNQKKEDLAIINKDDFYTKKLMKNNDANILRFSINSKADAYLENGTIFFQNSKIVVNNPGLQGPHNAMNVMAAILALSKTDLDISKIQNSINTFVALPHRLEFVDTINGVSFYNDSKATNTDAVIYALMSFGKKIRIILGGSDKGEDFSILNPHLIKYAKKIYLIGATKEKMEKDFAEIKSSIPIEKFMDFKTAITTAYKDSEKGDLVVLSPACASYDMFKNFEQRGEIFKKIVKALK